MKLAVAGAGGRMGRSLIEAIQADGGLSLAAALDAPGSAALGQPAGGVTVGADVDAAVRACEALIDFTRPEGTLRHLEACVRHGRAMVIGTTGFAPPQLQAIREAGQRIAIAFSPNFAVGVNVLFKLVDTAARALGEGFDIEIVEAHHRQKVDAPSGTALRLGEIAALATGRRLAETAVHGRQGDVGERTGREIGFHAVRGGDIVGEHTVMFAGIGERLELVVRSQSRMTYASGAVRAAKWLRGRPAGVYDMADVLGLK
ncbi:MAG TPA: 4-hydroxy-tetrahydrodipicolinate reductase [Burkholderiales bacterium]|nr:4-hydroxy-tetrahydrodipicolinate reductase [Burkholderiales bacterium]